MHRVGLLGAMVALCASSASWAGEVTIRRDEWGVPHIFASSPADAAYGLGWAQAEDRLDQLLTNYRLAAGTMAEAFGPDFVEHDFQQRLVGNEEVCRRLYPSLPRELRQMSESFIAGVKTYMADHPDQVPPWAPDLEPWMPAAFGRLIILNWPLGQAKDELDRRAEVDPGFADAGPATSPVRLAHLPVAGPFASNEWAVRPERTADGAAILLIDPHIPWDGPFRFYEFRAHAGRFQVSGFAPLGVPLIGLGHNDHLGWACTTGGPDTTDIYVEQLNPGNPLQYRYDGQWRDAQVRTVEIRVRGSEPVRRDIVSTHHGPVILREGNRAYAMACPYLSEIGLVEQCYRMNLARNLREFQDALAMCQFMEQNVMYADVDGNIYYCRTGRVPVRPQGFDFSKPVPGNTSQSEWMGLHPMADLVQVLNPAEGFLQNCNISPDTMTGTGPVRASDYPAHVFGDTPGRSNSRGRRAVERLSADDCVTQEDAITIALDTHAEGAEAWLRALRHAASATWDAPTTVRLRPALAILASWGGHMDADSEGATLYRWLREAARHHEPPVDADAIGQGRELDGVQQHALLESLAAAVRQLEKDFGRLRVPWGQVHRVRRGDRSWPAAGGESGGGMTLRAVGTTRDGAVYYGRSGQNWTQVVFFRKSGVVSFSANPYGQSDRPGSAHYTDQAERLFSRCRLKPTWFRPGALTGHVRSEQVLTAP